MRGPRRSRSRRQTRCESLGVRRDSLAAPRSCLRPREDVIGVRCSGLGGHESLHAPRTECLAPGGGRLAVHGFPSRLTACASRFDSGAAHDAAPGSLPVDWPTSFAARSSGSAERAFGLTAPKYPLLRLAQFRLTHARLSPGWPPPREFSAVASLVEASVARPPGPHGVPFL